MFVGLFFGPIDGAFVGLFFGLFAWMIIVGAELALGLLAGMDIGIKPAEIIAWSLNSSLRNFFQGPIFGLFAGLSFGLSFGQFYGPIFGLSLELIFGLGSGLVGGLSSETLDVHVRDAPNQGIWRSARNWSLSTLVIGLGSGLFFGSFLGLLNGLAVGLSAGLVSGLFFGGKACIHHIVLWLLLQHSGAIPRNYSRFLDHAARCILLRKVGGGYIFVHRLLLEYFASLDDEQISNEKFLLKPQVNPTAGSLTSVVSAHQE